MTDRPVLVLGGSRYQLPYIQAAQRIGRRVICLDINPDPPGRALADVFIQCDTTDHDRALEIARHQQVAGVIAPATDVAVSTKAIIDDALGLQGPPVDAAQILTDKAEFRRWRDGAENGVPWVRVDTGRMPDRMPLAPPFIIKPNRASGGRGARRIDTLAELQSVWRTWDDQIREGGAIAETWLDGKELSLEGFLRDGQFWFALVTSRQTPDLPCVATIGHRRPCGLQAPVQEQIIGHVEDVCRQLGVTDGPIDADIIYTTVPHILELSPRPGGNELAHLVSAVLGIDYPELAVQSALGEAPQGSAPEPCRRAAALDILHAPQSSRLTYQTDQLEAVQARQGLDILQIDVPSGTGVPGFKSGRDRLGAVLSTGSTVLAAEQAIVDALETISWTLSPPEGLG